MVATRQPNPLCVTDAAYLAGLIDGRTHANPLSWGLANSTLAYSSACGKNYPHTITTLSICIY